MSQLTQKAIQASFTKLLDSKPIDRIAALCGFAPLHLMTAFRRRYGVTMGAFRRNRILPPSSSSFGRSPQPSRN